MVKAEDRLIKKIGNWTTFESPNALSKSLVMSNTTGDKISFSFKGQLTVICFLRHDWSGIAEIHLDGEFLESLSPFCNLYQYGFEYMAEAEDDGEHTVDIVVTGERTQNQLTVKSGLMVLDLYYINMLRFFFCETCKTRFPVIDGVVDFTWHNDEMVKEYNAFLKQAEMMYMNLIKILRLRKSIIF